MIQLLWIEFVSKLAAGLLLLIAPLLIIRILGLPVPPTGFWPRLMGGLLFGLALATFMDTTAKLGHGLGLAGSMVINLALGLTLASVLFMKQGPQTRRGRVLLWGLSGALVLLALCEIAYI